MSESRSTTVIDTRAYTGALTLLFIGLKLGGVIAWSWWWVLSPLWIGLAIGLFILLVALGLAVVKS